MSRALVAFTLAALALGAPPSARAQAPAPQSIVRFAGQQKVRLEATPSGGAQRLTIQVGTGPAVEIHKGTPVLAKLATSDAGAAVMMVSPGSAPSVEFAIAATPPEGQAPKVVRATAPWKATPGHALFAGVATGDADGFTALWQEVGQDRAAVTRFARVRLDGTWAEKPKVVEVPWSLAAIAPNGHGYHLALFFDSGAPGQTRLSFVTLTADGRPEQHPWWVSKPELVDDVQLLPVAGGVTAFYRGGSDGKALSSTEVTSIGTWGTEPKAATAHGAIGEGDRYALKKGAGGKIEVALNP